MDQELNMHSALLSRKTNTTDSDASPLSSNNNPLSQSQMLTRSQSQMLTKSQPQMLTGSQPQMLTGSQSQMLTGSQSRMLIGSQSRVPIGSQSRIQSRIQTGVPSYIKTGSQSSMPIGSQLRMPIGSQLRMPIGSQSRMPIGPQLAVQTVSPTQTTSSSRILTVSPQGRNRCLTEEEKIYNARENKIIGTSTNTVANGTNASGTIEHFSGQTAFSSIFIVINFIAVVFAIYLSFKKNGSFKIMAFLGALCCPWLYIIYYFATKKMCKSGKFNPNTGKCLKK